jgi:cell division protein ZapA
VSAVDVTINGRQFRMACEDGQEDRLRQLADGLDARIDDLRQRFGDVGEARLTIMAAMMTADELAEARASVRALQAELAATRTAPSANSDDARRAEGLAAAALHAAAERIEKIAQGLNRAHGSGLAIG